VELRGDGMSKTIVLQMIIAIVLTSLFLACHEMNDPTGTITVAGVTLRGMSVNNARLINGNDFDVRIRKVYQSYGDTTEWIRECGAGESIAAGYASEKTGYYIATPDGVEIGFINVGAWWVHRQNGRPKSEEFSWK